MSLVAGLAVCYLLMVLALRAVENRIIFLPDREYRATPAGAGVPHKDVWLTTADSVRVHAWLLTRPEPAGAILFLHGNAGNISDRLENGVRLVELGFEVLLLDYRGYGESAGSPTEEGVYRDADAAYDLLLERLGGDARRLVVFGRSLGAGPAVELAARRPVGALAIESAFISTRALARDLFPYSLFAPFIPDRFRNRERIARVACPVLVLHGTRDEIIPFAHGRAVFEAAREPKTFHEIRGARHNDWYTGDPRTYFATWSAFLAGYSSVALPVASTGREVGQGQPPATSQNE